MSSDTITQVEIEKLHVLLLEAQSFLEDETGDEIDTSNYDAIAKPPEHIHTPLCKRVEGWEIMKTLADDLANADLDLPEQDDTEPVTADQPDTATFAN